MPDEMKVAIVAGVLSFLGAIGGTYGSSYWEAQRSDREFIQRLRAETLKTRLSLIEQCARARFHSSRLKTLSDFKDVENRRLASLDKGTSPPEQFVPKLFSLEMQREYAQLQSDQLTCTQMAALLFGPKTNEAAREISINTWTDPANPKLTAFLDAMVAEVTYFSH